MRRHADQGGRVQNEKLCGGAAEFAALRVRRERRERDADYAEQSLHRCKEEAMMLVSVIPEEACEGRFYAQAERSVGRRGCGSASIQETIATCMLRQFNVGVLLLWVDRRRNPEQ